MKTTLLTLTLALAAFLPTLPVAGQVPDRLKQSFINPNTGPQGGTALGQSVAMEGDYTVVGAPGDLYAEGFVGGGVVKVFHTTTGALLYTILAPNKFGGGGFGASVAISGTRIAVGAPGDENPEGFTGSVYVYDLTNARPAVPVAVLATRVSDEDDGFGYSVAIFGTRIAVGEDRQKRGNIGKVHVFDLASATPGLPFLTLDNVASADTDYTDTAVAMSGGTLVVGVAIDPDDSGPGRAYVYDLDGATPAVPVFTLNKPGTPTINGYGNAVAISGTRVVVADYLDNTGATDTGSAYVFDLASVQPTVPIAVLHNPNPGVQDRFGGSVGISGSRVVVGVDRADAGAVDAGRGYVYDLNSLTPAVPVVTLQKANPVLRDYFGRSVAISGTRAAIGAPFDDTAASDGGAVYVFDLASAAPATPSVILNATSPAVYDGFGGTVAVSGTLMAVGSGEDTGANNAGAVYVYQLNGATPSTLLAVLRSPNPEPEEHFGSVAISGKRIAILGRKAYVYDFSGSTPSAPLFVLDVSGSRIAMSGDRVAVTAVPIRGSPMNTVKIYDLSSPTPAVPVANLQSPVSDISRYFFGSALAISGTKVAVGNFATNLLSTSMGFGTVYIYDLSSSLPSRLVLTINNPAPYPSSDFGYSVAMADTRLLVGAFTVYLYDLSSETTGRATHVLESPGNAGGFGIYLGLSGSRIVVGAPDTNIEAYGAGAAYVYDLSSPTPTGPVARLDNPSPIVSDGFGIVAIDGANIVVGVPGDNTAGRGQGAAYVFGPSPYSLWKVSQLADPFAPDLGDTDGDGLGNLGEYGLLRSPSTPEGAATTAEPFPYADGRRLRMFVPRDPARDDITLEVQASGAVTGPWETIAISESGAPFAGPGYFAGDSAAPGIKSVEVRDTVKVNAATQRFLRVRVTR